MKSVSPVVISLIGPTAVGKTAAAEWLIKQCLAAGWNGVDLVVADSRQVYQGLEIVSGADINPDLQPVQQPNLPYRSWVRDAVEWHGVSIIKPDEEWSVAHFQTLFQAVWQRALAEQRVVLLVGGTGLYHDHIFTTDPALHVPPDAVLRAKTAQLTVAELQALVSAEQPARWQAMNQSDRSNPRRLVRALEIGQTPSLSTEQLSPFPEMVPRPPHQYWGLIDSLDTIRSRIVTRVEQRWQQGALGEVEALLAQFQSAEAAVKWPALSATGVKELAAYLADQLTEEQAKQLWVQREFQYAKRQLTWWRKQPAVQWVDVVEPGYLELLWRHGKNLLY